MAVAPRSPWERRSGTINTQPAETTSMVTATVYSALGSIANRSPPAAGPATVASWPATERRASAPASRLVGTISGVRERPAGAPNAWVTPVRAASVMKGQSSCAPWIVTRSKSPATTASARIAAAKSRTRGTRSAIWPAGSASSGSGTNSASPIKPRSNALWWIA